MPAMLRLIGLVLATAITCASAAEGAPEVPIILSNAKCVDGQPVNAALDPVIIHVNGKAYSVRVASKENAEAIRKMDPAAALKAILAFNRELADKIPAAPKP
jgi:hypothetical protein